MNTNVRLSIASVVLSLAVVLPAFSADLPTDSIYLSETHWQDTQGKVVLLPALAGSTQIVAFVYSHCLSMCPVIVADLQRVDEKLTASERRQVRFTLVSLDPDRDTPEVMQQFMATHSLDASRWQFLRGSNDDTRELALLFNIRYRQEGEEIAHSNTISVVDASGRLVYQRLGAGGLDNLLVNLRQSLSK